MSSSGLIFKVGKLDKVTIDGNTIVGPADFIKSMQSIKWKDQSMASRVATQYKTDPKSFNAFIAKHQNAAPAANKLEKTTLIISTPDGVFSPKNDSIPMLPSISLKEGETPYAAVKRLMDGYPDPYVAAALKVLSNAKKVKLVYKSGDDNISDHVYIVNLKKTAPESSPDSLLSSEGLSSLPHMANYVPELQKFDGRVKMKADVKEEMVSPGYKADDEDERVKPDSMPIVKAGVAMAGAAALPMANAKFGGTHFYPSDEYGNHTRDAIDDSLTPTFIVVSFLFIMILCCAIGVWAARLVDYHRKLNEMGSCKSPVSSIAAWERRILRTTTTPNGIVKVSESKTPETPLIPNPTSSTATSGVTISFYGDGPRNDGFYC